MAIKNSELILGHKIFIIEMSQDFVNAEFFLKGATQIMLIGDYMILKVNAYRNAYLDLNDIKVDVKSPDGTYNLGSDETPYQAVDLV